MNGRVNTTCQTSRCLQTRPPGTGTPASNYRTGNRRHDPAHLSESLSPTAHSHHIRVTTAASHSSCYQTFSKHLSDRKWRRLFSFSVTHVTCNEGWLFTSPPGGHQRAMPNFFTFSTKRLNTVYKAKSLMSFKVSDWYDYFQSWTQSELFGNFLLIFVRCLEE